MISLLSSQKCFKGMSLVSRHLLKAKGRCTEYWASQTMPFWSSPFEDQRLEVMITALGEPLNSKPNNATVMLLTADFEIIEK